MYFKEDYANCYTLYCNLSDDWQIIECKKNNTCTYDYVLVHNFIYTKIYVLDFLWIKLKIYNQISPLFYTS